MAEGFPQSSAYGIGEESWETEGDLEEGIEDLDVDEEVELEEEVEESEQEEFMLDGKPFVPKQQNRKLTFEESHVRITTYLEKDCHLIVRMLLKQGQIPSITFLINESVKAYLLNEFSEE
ncbi:hypothetical protein QMA04_00265 [Planococcus sp. APC 3900]|nr:hypothetical protein [Planococcus sp. APC 3900]